MQQTVGGDDAAPGRQPSALREIEGVAVEIADPAAGLFDDDGAGGVVPDLFAVAFVAGQAQVDRGFAASQDGVFALRVDAVGIGGDAEPPGDPGLDRVRRVGRLDRFADDGLAGVVDGVDRCGNGIASGDRCRPGAVGPRGVEDPAVAVPALAGRREVRTAEDTDDDPAAIDQSERDGVLLAAEKTLGPVDGIQDPVPTFGSTGVVASIEGGRDPIGVEFGRDRRDKGPDLFGHGGGAGERTRVLFGEEGVVGKAFGEAVAHDRLNTQIGQSDR